MFPAPVPAGPLLLGGGGPLFLIAGPCVIEGERVTMRIAERLARLGEETKTPVVFKASYDKANRTSHKSFRGPGLEEGLRILARVRERTGLPVLSDVHLPEEAKAAGPFLDVLPIPAFLCRQTDLLTAAARTGKAVNVKKAQFLAPGDVRHVVAKIEAAGGRKILVTERGTSFGYNTLVTDFRAIPILGELGYPVVFDGTHAVQSPGGQGDRSGGEGRFIPTLVRAAVAAGCDGVFLETHPDPARARSDGPNMVPLKELPALWDRALAIREALGG